MGNDVGKREIVYKGKSDLSGEFVVEDVLGADDDTFRRLIFLNNQFVIQSEAQLTLGKMDFWRSGISIVTTVHMKNEFP